MVTAAPARRRPVVAEDQIVIGNFAEAPLDWIAIRLFANCTLEIYNSL